MLPQYFQHVAQRKKLWSTSAHDDNGTYRIARYTMLFYSTFLYVCSGNLSCAEIIFVFFLLKLFNKAICLCHDN